MSKERRCKGCNKILSENYNGKYCQSCMNEQVDKGKGIFKGLASVLGVFIMIITLGKKGK